MSTEKVSSAKTIRRTADFHPSLWGNHFLTCASETSDTMTQQQYKELKEDVRRMLTSDEYNKTSQKLNLIDTVQRLGVAYHFEKEVEDELEKIHHQLANDEDDDLYTVSLRFRLLRQQGIRVLSDVFEKFKDGEGKFKASMMNDVQGMLSLYEAAYLAIHGEDILDEAITFTTTHLKSILATHHVISPNLAEQINHALYHPLRKSLPRIEARYFLDVYSKDDLHDKTLLKFAKLDFNKVQAAHQKELSDSIRWWRDLDFTTKLPYARDRIVECYFWMMEMCFEPRYALARSILTKMIQIISIIDDTFDAYATFEELQLFVEAVKRWDIGFIDILPHYMKVIYTTLLDIFNETEEELAKEGRSFCIHYAKEKMQELVQQYFAEAKWLNEGYVPKMEEYMLVALRSTGVLLIITSSFLGMGDIATKGAFEWVVSRPKIVIASEKIGRLMDDMASHKFEQKRGHVASAVECYMKQHGASEEEAEEFLSQENTNAWKDINEGLLNPIAVPLPLLERILNTVRTTIFMYENGDRYTHPYLMKDHVALVLRDPIML
nr:bergamotene/farnesene synthase [Zanthoxylum ailanthoides]